MDENALSEILMGFSSGYSKAQAEKQKFKQALQQDLQKAMILQQMRQETSPKSYAPTTRQEWEEAERFKAGLRSPIAATGQLPREAPEGFEITQYDVQGRPLIKKIDISKQKAAGNESEMIRSDAQNSLNTITEIKKGLKYFGKPTTPIPALYGTPKAVWEANVNRLLSQKVVDLIMKMKSASKTGATGFGQLSEREGQLLREASTALNKKLPEGKALEYLNDMEKIYKKIAGETTEPDINTMAGPRGSKNYIRTGIDKDTGRKVGMLPDGTMEFIR